MVARVPTDRPGRAWTALYFGVPALILVASYAWLALDRGTIRLWQVPVHESGRYTLVGTVLYYGHFLREIPTDIAYALFVVGAAGRVLPTGEVGDAAKRRRLRLLVLAAALGAAALVTIALVRSAALQGWNGALRDLLQMRTRDDLVAYGSHWRFHWLSTLWFGLTAGLAVPLLARTAGPAAADDARGRIATRLAWGWFVGLTLVFGVSAETFTDVRYAGHQAREIMTHGPLTGLLAIGMVRLLAARFAPMRAAAPAARSRRLTAGWSRPEWLAASLCVIIPLWLAAVTLAGDPMQAGQSGQGLSAMLAGHVFEHVADYVLVVLLVAGGCALMMERRTR